MASGFVIRKNQYYDSVFLMGVNRRLSDSPGVRQTAVLMGSEKNKELLADIGVHDPQIDAAQPNDLIVAVVADSQQIVENVIGNLDQALVAVTGDAPTSVYRTFEDGMKQKPAANLAVISIPGEYVAREANKALDAGLNVFIFSSNVSIDDELQLKNKAKSKNLLVMGPDCGTSIFGGVGVGFANAVRKGKIGVIGASGTGLQEFTCQVHNAGLGISHAIGTGTNDVSDAIGGLTTFAALKALEADPSTDVIAFVSKPPGTNMLSKLTKRLEGCQKPVVCCFLGAEKLPNAQDQIQFVRTIDEAVQWVFRLGSGVPVASEPQYPSETIERIRNERESWSPDQKYLFSNAPIDSRFALKEPYESRGHTIVDMGDEFFTLGKPHPMIDGTLRKHRILTEGQDPQVAILFLDFILGYNSSLDPVGELLDGIIQAKQAATQRGSHLTVVASMCGTEDDPQDMNLQCDLLKDEGVFVFKSNAEAAKFCAQMLLEN
jgi:succinyl-CoA synthetase alpha subunit